jgi:MoaA/NifB/PqqE/SkfB family radical SAM enzyme
VALEVQKDGLDLAILYRGDLKSCNYACTYCPFAKAVDTRAELESDGRALDRFADWVAHHGELALGVLFTPWGEALIRPAYRAAFARLSWLPHVRKVAAQTNLSFAVDWLNEVDRRSAALWCTYHPSQTSRDAFLARCARLDALGVRYSVGMVGLREHFEEIRAMRRALPRAVYLWVNAYKRQPSYYAPDELRMLEEVDPHFPTNLRHHPSLGRPCRAGHRAIAVDARGTVRRCHFIEQPLGNLYQDDLAGMLAPRPCTRATCGCHIGYVHLEELRLDETYGSSILERIPIAW